MNYENLGRVSGDFGDFEAPKLQALESQNLNVRMITKALGAEKVRQLDAAANRLAAGEVRQFDSAAEVEDFFADYSHEFRETHDAADYDEVKNYTGFNYKYINSVLRGQWDYNNLGPRSTEKEQEMLAAGEHLSAVIRSAPELPENITTYRGTNLDAFRGYGVSNLAELADLEGQFYYENGFTSTSLVRAQSFYDREFDDTYRTNCNVEVEYLLPAGSRDGIPATTEELSYSPAQNEFLLDRDSLFKICKVAVNGDQAHVQMALIPKSEWDN